jgi:hypothetical protein
VPSGGTKDAVPGDFAHRESRTQGWKDGTAIDPGGERVRVTSGVRDSLDLQFITPESKVEICFPFLEVIYLKKIETYDDNVTSRDSTISTKNS